MPLRAAAGFIGQHVLRLSLLQTSLRLSALNSRSSRFVASLAGGTGSVAAQLQAIAQQIQRWRQIFEENYFRLVAQYYAEALLTNAKAQCPVQTGALRRSLNVTNTGNPRSGGMSEIVVVSNLDYFNPVARRTGFVDRAIQQTAEMLPSITQRARHEAQAIARAATGLF